MVNCDKCKGELTLEQVLHNCHCSWPNQSWLGFVCPLCKREMKAYVKRGYLSLGDLDGAPGPAFFESSFASDFELKVSVSLRGVRCTYKGETFFFKAKA